MRARFVRGEDPKKALGIGKYSEVWGKIEDLIREELKELDSMPNPKHHQDVRFFLSRDRNRLGVYFPHANEFITNQIFSIFNSAGLFHHFNAILQEYESDAYIGANVNNPEYFEYDIPDELFVEGKFMEFYIIKR